MKSILDAHGITIGVIATVAAAFIVAATSWNFLSTAELPEKYVLKKDYQCDTKEIKDKLDQIQSLILRLHMEKSNGKTKK